MKKVSPEVKESAPAVACSVPVNAGLKSAGGGFSPVSGRSPDRNPKKINSIDTVDRLLLRKAASPTYNKVKINIDTNSFEAFVGSDLDFDIVCSKYVHHEASKFKNFKAGIDIVASKKEAGGEISSESIGLFESSLDLSSIETTVWKGPAEAGPEAGVDISPILRKNIALQRVHTDQNKLSLFLLKSIVYLILNRNSDMKSHKEKCKHINEFIGKVAENGQDIKNCLEQFIRPKINDALIDNLIRLVSQFTVSFLLKCNTDIKLITSALSEIDNYYLAKDNEDEIRKSCSDLENDFSIFYSLYRMEYYSDPETTSSIRVRDKTTTKLSSLTNPQDFELAEKARKKAGVKRAYEDFRSFLWEKCPEGIKMTAFKNIFSMTCKELKNMYTLYDSSCVSVSDKSQSFLNKSKAIKLEKDIINSINNIGKYFNADDIQQYFIDSLFKRGSDARLIDGSFDANDFAICWDSIERGIPLFTVNKSMQQQIWQNFYRAYLLGRDLQLIVPKEIDLFHSLNGNKIEGGVDGIKSSHILKYCIEHREMSKLWGWGDIGEKYKKKKASIVGGIVFPDITSKCKGDLSKSPGKDAGRGRSKDSNGGSSTMEFPEVGSTDETRTFDTSSSTTTSSGSLLNLVAQEAQDTITPNKKSSRHTRLSKAIEGARLLENHSLFSKSLDGASANYASFIRASL